MKLIIPFLFLIFNFNTLLCQETFPINGVKDNFNPIYAFTNAHIFISPGKQIKNGTLIIHNDKIISVDSNLIVPKNAIVYDLQGDHIYPSFIDLYSNYGIVKTNLRSQNDNIPQYRSNKKGAYHWNQAIHPETQASHLFSNNQKEAEKYINIGFGSVLTHYQDGIMRGSGAFVLLSENNHTNIISDFAASFYSFKKGSSKQKYPTSLMGSIALIKQVMLDAEWYEKQKKQTNLSYISYNLQNKLPKIFEISNVLDYSRVFSIADEFEIDFLIKGNGKEYSRIHEVKGSTFPIIIPLNFPKAYDVSNPESTEWISLNQLKEWELAPYNPVFLSDNNIKFCFTSSDLEDKNDFLKNLKKTIDKGLNKSDALASLTTIPASLINMSNKLGTLESGKIANFIITSSDIFEDGVIYENWINGKKHIVNKKEKYDISGYYTFKSKKINNSKVIIKGQQKNVKISINNLDSANLTGKISGDNFNFSLPNGHFRANGDIINNDTIIGFYQDENGNIFDFLLSKDSVLKADNNKKDSDITNKIIQSNIPEVWLPNKSNGFRSLPIAQPVLFKNATVWTNEKQGIINNTDVIIDKGKIVAIGTLLNPLEYITNEKVKIIDASNLHLTCGIIDEHSHIAISKGVNEASQAVTAEVSIGDVINPNDHNIYRQLAGGVVAAQLLHGSANPIGGRSAIVKLRWGASAEEMKISDAKGFIKFALGENVKQSNWGDFENIRFPQTRMGVEQVFYDAFFRAKEYEKKWQDYNKLNLIEKRKTVAPREDIELNVLVEILNSERFITCHSYVQSEINMLMHVADSMGFKINTFTHILEGYKIAEKMKKHGVGGSTFSDWWAYKFEVNDAIPYNASLLNEAGIVTAINSDDAEMGRRLNQEAAKAIKYGGTSEEDAWKMITLNPAKLLYLDDKMGSIKIGKDADIVLWSDNPLSVYSKVVQTYVDGKLMYDENVDVQNRKRDLKERMRIIKLMSKDKNQNKIKPTAPAEEKLYHCCKKR